MRISWSGRLSKVSSWAFCAEVGERARFLVGRRERGSAETGMDSGPVPDIVTVVVVYVEVLAAETLFRWFGLVREGETTWRGLFLVGCWLLRGVVRPNKSVPLLHTAYPVGDVMYCTSVGVYVMRSDETVKVSWWLCVARDVGQPVCARLR